MKKLVLTAALGVMLFASQADAQKLAQAQVPSVVVNSFQKTFSKAADVEWELKGEWYKVEFETGLFGKDHDAWFDQTGKLIKHQEEWTAGDLPAVVKSKIASEYNGFRIDDIDKITQGTKISYRVELKKKPEEWIVEFDAQGNTLNKKAD